MKKMLICQSHDTAKYSMAKQIGQLCEKCSQAAAGIDILNEAHQDAEQLSL